MAEGLSVLSFEESKTVLAKHAAGAQIPWAMIQETVFDFMKNARKEGLFLTQANGSDTINAMQEALSVEGKNVQFGIPNGKLEVLTRVNSRNLIDEKGKKALALWGMASGAVFKFIDHLYAYNVFFAVSTDQAANLILEKTANNSLTLRIKTQVAGEK